MATTLEMKTAAIRLEPGPTIKWELSTPEFRQAFRAGNPSAHDALVELIDDKLDELDQELGLIITLSDKDTATAVYDAVFGIITVLNSAKTISKRSRFWKKSGTCNHNRGRWRAGSIT